MARVFARTFSVFARRLAKTQPANMSSTPELGMFLPPVNRSMRELDRSFFKKQIALSACTVTDWTHISMLRKTLKSTNELLDVPGVPPLVNNKNDPEIKFLILSPNVKHNDPTTWSQRLTDLEKAGVVRLRPYELKMVYENWTMADILAAVLPELPQEEKETPAGFAQAGHVAHLNITRRYLPYKYLIGMVLADKNPNVKTVINKTYDVGSESVFRTFPYEVLYGPDDMNVTTKHCGCQFEFNFAKVYWNSRLNMEHERLSNKFKSGEAVCDVMAGVGPFALPAGKREVFVRANDLNPHCYDVLKDGIRKNKVGDYVKASCLDGRIFIINETKSLRKNRRSFRKPVEKPKVTRFPKGAKKVEPVVETILVQEPMTFDHYVMNLPATAVDFLDAFKGLYAGREQEFMPHTDRKLPMIHVYTFQPKHKIPEQEMQEVCEKVSEKIGAPIKLDDPELEVELRDVRLVSPMKKMYCASFRLPSAVAFTRGSPS